MPIFEIALDEAWAMRGEALTNLLAIADRQNLITPEAIEAYRTEYAARAERLRMRDDVAIVDMAGPLFKKANLLQAMSGASSYAIMARDFQAAIDDPAVRGILLNIDSPGGSVNGCDELATLIASARGKKPIIAYASGQACSAAYWLATAADKIILSDASAVGSIGVILGIEDRTAADEKRGVRTIEFVSSKAPGKRPDYSTDEGKALIQRRVDDLEAVFIAAVAKNRGISADTVISDFGAGGVEIGANAVKLKMADQVGGFEDAFAQLTGGKSRRLSLWSKGNPMTTDSGATAAEDAVKIKADLDKARADASKAARDRIKAIVGSPEGKANVGLAEHFAYDTETSAEDAIKALKAAGPAAVPAAEPTEEAKAAAYLKGKERSGSLGFATSTEAKALEGPSIMQKAAQNINARNKVRTSA